MSSGFAAQVELLGVLVRADEQAREALSATECDLILDVCTQVVAMAPALAGCGVADVARATRCGAQLLLDHTVPGVDPALRTTLARAVGRIVLRQQRTA